MKRKILSALLCMAVFFSFPMAAHADIGPKPSVNVTFEGVKKGTEYYGTLLSDRDSTGPSSAWDGVEGHQDYHDGEEEIWQAFADYPDTDSYYFLQEWWNCTGTDQLNWTYYPPSKFKILLWFPETDTYFVSDIYERYAFDSYYTVNLSDMAASEPADGIIVAEKSYDFTWEIISLIARIVATILLEIAVAFIFGYRSKKAIRFIAVVNIITQVLLNLTLNFINYSMGSMTYVFFFVMLEIAVFVLEAVIYALLLRKFTDRKADCMITTAYAFAANAVSFAAGMWLSFVIPGIF